MKKFFPSLLHFKDKIFMENAGGSQIPFHVLNSFNKFITDSYMQPGKSNLISNNNSKNINEIYKICNIILNNNNSGQLYFGSSTSQLSYNLSHSLSNYLIKDKNSEIILSDFNHESCITPFERIALNNKIKINWFSLNKFKINYSDLINQVNENTKLIVLPHASNLLGNILDIKYLSREIKKINKNTLILVDGVAYLPHNIIDVEELNIDFYFISFYKFCGLRTSVVYCKNETINLIENQNHYFLENNKEKNLDIGGLQFENASSIIGLKDYLLEIYPYFKYIIEEEDFKLTFNRKVFTNLMTNIINYENNLIQQFYNNLKDNNEITILEDKSLQKIPIFSLKFKNYNENNISLILNQLDIFCKNGTFYCDRFFEKENLCKDSGVLRISLLHYNTIEEINTLCYYLNLFKKNHNNFEFSYFSDYFTLNNENEKYNQSYLKNYFNQLKEDPYYENLRLRNFSLLQIDDNIKICGDLNFYQSNSYNSFNGNKLREYPNICNKILKDPYFNNIINKFNTILSSNLKISNKFIQIHLIRVYAQENPINLIPEGIHQDGFNIVGMICINRENISGGISQIFDKEKKIIFEKELQNGEMLILNDNKLFHSVTNIELNNKNKIGYRDIMVLTTIS